MYTDLPMFSFRLNTKMAPTKQMFPKTWSRSSVLLIKTFGWGGDTVVQVLSQCVVDEGFLHPPISIFLRLPTTWITLLDLDV